MTRFLAIFNFIYKPVLIVVMSAVALPFFGKFGHAEFNAVLPALWADQFGTFRNFHPMH